MPALIQSLGPLDKPAYRVPSMAEVRAVPDCGIKVASTFSGAGGSCLGFKMAGLRVLWANEFVPAAADTYAANFPDVVLDRRDVRLVTADELLTACGIEAGQLDVLEGSPPCQSFSIAGRRQKGWGKVKRHADGSEQRSDDLFAEFMRLLCGVRPRAFVAENVRGLTMGVARGHFNRVLASMRESGYRVVARILDAQWLGVPQMRSRVFFVGYRDDLGIEPVFPAPLTYRYSLAEACPEVVSAAIHRNGSFHSSNVVMDKRRPAFTITTKLGDHMVTVAEPAPRPEGVDPADLEAPGVSDNLRRKAEMLIAGRNHDRAFNLVVADSRKPCPTMLATWGQPGIHQVLPATWRRFSILELKRICSFPDDFKLTGSYSERWARLGNSVPPLMMRAVAECMRDALLEHDAARGR